MSEGPVKQYIEKVKSIPLAIYLLVIINIILFVGLLFKQLTILYLLGSLIFVIMLLAAIGSGTALWANPTQLISENVRARISEASEKAKEIVTAIDLKQNSSSATTTLVTILFVVYMTSIVNETIETFLIFNFAYAWVFLPKETDGVVGIVKENARNLNQKLKSFSKQ